MIRPKLLRDIILLRSWKLCLATLAGFYLIGCIEFEEPTGIWPLDDTDQKPNPEIVSVLPGDSVYSGITVVTITGNNFSDAKNDNLVYFGESRAVIETSSETELKVRAPNVEGDSLVIKVMVIGALEHGEYYPYKVKPAVIEYGVFVDVDDAYGLAMDPNENLFVSLVGKKVVKVDSNGVKTDYSSTTFEKISGMKYGPDGGIYALNLLQYMSRIPPGGGQDALFSVLPGGAYDLDFDSLGNMYAAGGGEAIYAVASDGSARTVADYSSITIYAVRVYNGCVYIAGRYNGADTAQVQEGIWKNLITSATGDLGQSTLVFDWGDYVGKGGPHILSITFAADGAMLIGADRGDAVTILRTDGTLEPLYPYVLEAPIYAMCWGNGKYLYINCRDQSKRRIYRLLMGISTAERGAPYYGRQ